MYTDQDVHLIEVLLHLRDTGMPLARIAEFTRYVAADPAGVPERLALLEAHRANVVARLAAWQDSLALIDGKITDYRIRLHQSDSDPAAPVSHPGSGQCSAGPAEGNSARVNEVVELKRGSAARARQALRRE